MKKYFIIVLGFLLFGGIVINSMISPEFKNKSDYIQECPGKIFVKSSLIFDSLRICWTDNVSDEKLEHATNVAAKWLDNDENWVIDNEKLWETLKSNKPVVVMSWNGFSNLAMMKLQAHLWGVTSQDLSAAETNPGGWERDASQEEIHHIIMNAWWIQLYPEYFSDRKEQKSTLYKLWEQAEQDKNYKYNDPTCNDACKVTEFVYLASAAYLWSDIDLESDEMMIKNRSELKEKLPEILTLFENKEFQYPVYSWPDWKYKFPENIDVIK